MASERDKSAVLWLTGLPGSGKTTIATRVAMELQTHRAVEHLDGDAIRQLFPQTSFERAGREEHILRVGYLASRLEYHGVTVVVSLVSPYASVRSAVRAMCRRFLEIHVATPLAECERRDPKGLYAKARRGDLTNFTGVSDVYEPPAAPELSIDTSRVDLTAAVSAVLRALDNESVNMV